MLIKEEDFDFLDIRIEHVQQNAIQRSPSRSTLQAISTPEKSKRWKPKSERDLLCTQSSTMKNSDLDHVMLKSKLTNTIKKNRGSTPTFTPTPNLAKRVKKFESKPLSPSGSTSMVSAYQTTKPFLPVLKNPTRNEAEARFLIECYRNASICSGEYKVSKRKKNRRSCVTPPPQTERAFRLRESSNNRSTLEVPYQHTNEGKKYVKSEIRAKETTIHFD